MADWGTRFLALVTSAPSDAPWLSSVVVRGMWAFGELRWARLFFKRLPKTMAKFVGKCALVVDPHHGATGPVERRQLELLKARCASLMNLLVCKEARAEMGSKWLEALQTVDRANAKVRRGLADAYIDPGPQMSDLVGCMVDRHALGPQNELVVTDVAVENLFPGRMNRLCLADGCINMQEAALVCSGCGSTYYCNQACQKSHRAQHRPSCWRFALL